MTPCEEEGTVVGRAFGALEPDEDERVDEHLTTCAQCRRTLDDALGVTLVLGTAVPQVDPPADLRERLMDAVRAEPEPDRRPAPEPVGTRRTTAADAAGGTPPADRPGRAPTVDGPPDATHPPSPEQPHDGDRPGLRRRSMILAAAVVAAVVVGFGLLGVGAILPSQSDSSPPGSTAAMNDRAQRIVDDAANREPGTRHATLHGRSGRPVAVVLDETAGPRVVPVAMPAAESGHRYVLWSTTGDDAVPTAWVDATDGTTTPLPGAARPPTKLGYAMSLEVNGPVPPRPTIIMGVGLLR